MRAIGLCVAAQGEMPPGDVAAQGGGAKAASSSTELGEHIPCGLTFTHPYPYPYIFFSFWLSRAINKKSTSNVAYNHTSHVHV